MSCIAGIKENVNNNKLRHVSAFFFLSIPVLILSACGGGSDTGSASPVVSATLLLSVHEAQPQPNADGTSLTFSTRGSIDTGNPFFTPLGNGRACVTCHQESEGWSVTPDGLAARFAQSNGSDPIFRLVDGATSPNAASATLEQKRLAYTMLLTKGLIRVGLPVPATAEFTLIDVDDPYGYASAKEMSLFRRPLQTANLKFESTLMWDGRETTPDANSTRCIVGALPAACFSLLDVDLSRQANDAVRGHAEAAADLNAADQRAIVDFQNSLFTAQIFSNEAGNLNDGGALGGPSELAKNNFNFGIIDLGRDAMTLFAAWGAPVNQPTAKDVARASIRRGEVIFNTRTINLSAVKQGTCANCHSTPNSGTDALGRLFNTGVSDGALRTPDMPLYTLKNKQTGEVVTSTDPGAGLISGKWTDIGRFKATSLRALAARAPYFHNGAVKELSDVVKFYDKRFQIGFAPQEIADLTAFLKAL